jgi:hypothetical protein
MVENNEDITSKQEWRIRFTETGQKKFRSFGGPQNLSESVFDISVPEQKGRTGANLFDEILALGIIEICEKCQKFGIDICLEDIQSLKSRENLVAKQKF